MIDFRNRDRIVTIGIILVIYNIFLSLWIGEKIITGLLISFGLGVVWSMVFLNMLELLDYFRKER